MSPMSSFVWSGSRFHRSTQVGLHGREAVRRAGRVGVRHSLDVSGTDCRTAPLSPVYGPTRQPTHTSPADIGRPEPSDESVVAAREGPTLRPFRSPLSARATYRQPDTSWRNLNVACQREYHAHRFGRVERADPDAPRPLGIMSGVLTTWESDLRHLGQFAAVVEPHRAVLRGPNGHGCGNVRAEEKRHLPGRTAGAQKAHRARQLKARGRNCNSVIEPEAAQRLNWESRRARCIHSDRHAEQDRCNHHCDRSESLVLGTAALRPLRHAPDCNAKNC